VKDKTKLTLYEISITFGNSRIISVKKVGPGYQVRDDSRFVLSSSYFLRNISLFNKF